MSSSPKEIFNGVYQLNDNIATANLVYGQKVYNEQLIDLTDKQLRIWNPFRSKLAAAIIKGLEDLPIQPGSKVLYLGASTGTTASHVSDIVGEDGIVFCVEFAKRSMMDLIKVCQYRQNMIPLLADARLPNTYSLPIDKEANGNVDVIYQDVADDQQVRILVENAKMYLSDRGHALICIKARSINAIADPNVIFKSVIEELGPHFNILSQIDLSPYDKDHLFLLLNKK